MADEVSQLARQLLDSEVTKLSEREQRVILHIANRLHVARDVNGGIVKLGGNLMR